MTISGLGTERAGHAEPTELLVLGGGFIMTPVLYFTSKRQQHNEDSYTIFPKERCPAEVPRV